MRLGLYNSCLLEWEPERLLGWAAANGFSAVELHAGPRYRHVDWRAVADGRTGPLLEAQERHGVRICGLMYGALGFLSPDPVQREQAVADVEILLRAARRSGIALVSTFTGRDPALTLEQNLEAFGEVFPRVADLAERHGIDLAFENCPMFQVWPWIHNIAISPALWRRMFELVPSPRLGLNLDPSHLVWQGVDWRPALTEFRDRLKLVQAKDTEVLPEVKRDEGILTPRWWRHRIPGEGMIDWRAFLSAVRAAGYDGIVSVEHEDPRYEGSEDRVLEGVLKASAHLVPLLRDEGGPVPGL
jgi:sugar phosphate isomerase/epimerase